MAAVCHLPRAKAELEMMLDAVASRLAVGAAVLVHGLNNNGIRSAATVMERLLGPVTTLATRQHARVLMAYFLPRPTGLRDTLALWRRVNCLDLGAGEQDFVSYPGVFADGRLDPGSALLIRALPKPGPAARVLDFGAGTGLLAVALGVEPAQIDLLDCDSVALEAARENLPDARTILAAGIHAARGPYDMIISNPPIHQTSRQELGTLTGLLASGQQYLRPAGSLWLVTQKRIPVEQLATTAGWGGIAAVADNQLYRVWRMQPKGRPNRNRRGQP